MTWEIVVGLISLVGLVGTFVSATVKFSKTVTTLDVTLKDLKETLEEFRSSNREHHKEFYERIDNHEHRICRLENSSEYCRKKE